MKKILFTLMAVALCLTACDEDYTDWKAPQSNPQEEAQNVVVNVTPAADIELANVTAQSIELGQVAAELPEGYVTDSTALDVVNADGTTTPTHPYRQYCTGKRVSQYHYQSVWPSSRVSHLASKGQRLCLDKC